jgi:glycosyltransferase involved in cell wall biosynthesis
MAKISVVLVVKNESAIDQTLTMLFSQIGFEDVECIVIDASRGNLVEISLKFPAVIWLDFESKNPHKRISIAEQRNLGIRASNCEVIVFCDAGGLPEPGWLNAISSPLLSGQEHLVGGPIHATNLGASNVWTNLQLDGEEIQYPTTANLGLTRNAFDLVGGFNEDLDYGSDADLVWRLNEQGIKQVCVAEAVMGLDGGTRSREYKRAWRYGKALADLLLLHPQQCLPKAKSNPEIWIYPLLTLVAILALLPFESARLLRPAFLIANLILVLRNVGAKRPGEVLINHYIYGWGFCLQFLRRRIHRFKIPKVLIYPSDGIRYLSELNEAIKFLKQNEITVGSFPKLTRSNTLNIVLMPLLSPLLRFRGTEILHIHWLYRFGSHRYNSKILKNFRENWFKLWIYSLNCVGIKVLWTAHNILPHNPIFRDDLAIRRFLVQRSAAVVSLSQDAEQVLKKDFEPRRVYVIPEGPLHHPTTFSRAEFRNRLQVPKGNILLVSLGNLAPYKGLSDLLRASRNLTNNVSIRIAGWCEAAEQGELERLCAEAKRSGTDIQIAFTTLTKNEYGGYLQAADFYAAPFRKITNSGSLNAALTAGVPVVIPDLPSLQWIPREAAVVYQPDLEGNELAHAIESLTIISFEKVVSMQSAGVSFTAQNPWSLVAEQHISLYSQILKSVKINF